MSIPCHDKCDQAGRVSVYIVTGVISNALRAAIGADDKYRTTPTLPNPLKVEGR